MIICETHAHKHIRSWCSYIKFPQWKHSHLGNSREASASFTYSCVRHMCYHANFHHGDTTGLSWQNPFLPFPPHCSSIFLAYIFQSSGTHASYSEHYSSSQSTFFAQTAPAQAVPTVISLFLHGFKSNLTNFCVSRMLIACELEMDSCFLLIPEFQKRSCRYSWTVLLVLILLPT